MYVQFTSVSTGLLILQHKWRCYDIKLIAKVSKVLKKTSKMEFVLVKQQAHSVQSANLLKPDFTTDSFWKLFRKLAVLKRLSWKILWCNSVLTLKRLEGQFDPPCGFLKNVSSKESVKPCFFVTFNIIINHIFPENFNEIPRRVQKIWKFSSWILTIFTNFSDFLSFLC